MHTLYPYPDLFLTLKQYIPKDIDHDPFLQIVVIVHDHRTVCSRD